MKPHQRKFIVEFKSPRRRSTIRPASIWGDTDLKALVRKSESEAPHLFAAVDQPAGIGPGPSAAVGVEIESVLDSVSHVADAIAAPQEVTVPPDRAEDASALHADVIPATKTAPQLYKVPRQARGRRARSNASEAPIQVSVDDLAALEEENRRLKALLAHRLRQENARLGSMLARFK
ncbi:hypothetical protein HT585_23275 [Ensifer sp. HO-A22]|uniref:Uncharacterized protein n=1 Tax=Ensifer oleiphilus TaxID=2742698 RepID=A0A7Y6QA10_9HYPH|nr:hypothetical protein [Ensifer oleiphilus]NVD41794.1 hypothetical protein [Ensifer oleiphilus]